jgi:hypothetical protein
MESNIWNYIFFEDFEKTSALIGGVTGLVSAMVSYLALTRDQADISSRNIRR